MITPNAPLLDVNDIAISFGGIKAVQDFSLHLPKGALYGLIGPNGAGKTTVFNLLTGIYRTQSGSMRLDGVDLCSRRPHKIASAGLARTFQNIRLFGEMSVLDNVRLACHLRCRHQLGATFFHTRAYAAQERAILDRAHELLEIFGLEDRADQQAKQLPYGHQRQLEIIRALATEPKVLLLDEPAAGMNPQEKESLSTAIRHIRERFDLAILLIEHDMGLVMEICQRITVLVYGVIIAEGTPAEVQNDPKVIEAYLGAPAAPEELEAILGHAAARSGDKERPKPGIADLPPPDHGSIHRGETF